MSKEKQRHGHKWMPIMYVHFFGILKEIAEQHGYALAAHGSFVRDMDLIAVPWVDNAKCPLVMLAAMAKALGRGQNDCGESHDSKEEKPHGRIAYTIPTGGGGWIDISIMERR